MGLPMGAAVSPGRAGRKGDEPRSVTLGPGRCPPGAPWPLPPGSWVGGLSCPRSLAPLVPSSVVRAVPCRPVSPRSQFVPVPGRLDGRKRLPWRKRQARGPSGVCQPPGASSGVTRGTSQPASRGNGLVRGGRKGEFILPGTPFLWPRKGSGGSRIWSCQRRRAGGCGLCGFCGSVIGSVDLQDALGCSKDRSGGSVDSQGALETPWNRGRVLWLRRQFLWICRGIRVVL